MTNQRTYIENGTYMEVMDKTGTKRTIIIDEQLDGPKLNKGEGASTVCYRASLESGQKGVLKEFYPSGLEGAAFKRNQKGQLVLCDDTVKAEYDQLWKEYLQPYEMLLELRRDVKNKDLNTFIPNFEVYYGIDEKQGEMGTGYIWSMDPELDTFEAVCQKIHEEPNEDAVKKLIMILAAIKSLTECVLALHRAGLVHRDIKPANFGFRSLDDNILTQTVSLFDVNTICPIMKPDTSGVGTPGYCEPEIGLNAINKTDIYSIGATLFHAMIVTEETENNGFVYKKEYYPRLRELINESKLIKEVSETLDGYLYLKEVLYKILKESLSGRNGRYEKCEHLRDDLEEALNYLLPADIARRMQDGAQWKLIEFEESLDQAQKRSVSLAIQYHLYEHPLYTCCKEEERCTDVLLIGFGLYGQKFLDACLQAGQIPNQKLRVTVASVDKPGNINEKDIYLEERPELENFFNINNHSVEEDSYGDIFFKTVKLERRNPDANRMALRQLLHEQHPHYIFVAVGNDEQNIEIANLCKDELDAFSEETMICYAFEGKRTEMIDERFVPIYVSKDVKEKSIHAEIHRMAFNAHLTWEKNLNVAYEDVKHIFMGKYNYDASVANVLSIKYKLHALGIDLSKVGFHQAASQFGEIISDEQIRNQMIWVEHRRWVTEKICNGWRNKPVNDCKDGITRDTKHKKHVCIVKSQPNQILADLAKEDEKVWKKSAKSDLERMDELDRMSVLLHRLYVDMAKKEKKGNFGTLLSAIKNRIDNQPDAMVAYQEWVTCTKAIWEGDRRKIRLYKGLKEAFLNTAKSLDPHNAKYIENQIQAFENLFNPIKDSMELRIWKEDDAKLIDNIPFILTYTQDLTMVIPFDADDQNSLFSNVAAPTVVNPKKIIYLYEINKILDENKLKHGIPRIVEYMQKKPLRSALEFVLVYDNAFENEIDTNYINEIKKLGKGYIKQVKTIVRQNGERRFEKLEAHLKQKSKGSSNFVVEKKDGSIAGYLEGSGFFQNYANYEFNSITGTFKNINGCELLRYIENEAFITVSDMMTLQLATGEPSDQPEFYNDYESLWEKYNDAPGAWKSLCRALGTHASKQDILVRLKTEKVSSVHRTYILPFACSKSVQKILDFLKETDLIEKNSSVNGYTTDSCKVLIVDKCDNGKQFDALFGNIYSLMMPEALTMYKHKPKAQPVEVIVEFDNLVVKGLKTDDKWTSQMRALLQFFSDERYVNNLQITGNDISFTYASKQVKELMTIEGKILEVYVYHKAKASGEFDDVLCSYEIKWENRDVLNEIDCIITKGFKSLFIECKARRRLEQQFYQKIDSLTDQFAVNGIPVLIADTKEDALSENNTGNETQRARGNLMDIETIWEKNQLESIEEELLNCLNKVQ